ncbi:MAG: extracellular solute-binding protein [Limnochordia bacterium]|jgi:ABC-type glycerol-3-phosphate transport system substrate-binding protein
MHRLTRLFLALMTIVALSGVASAAVSTEIEFWVTFGGAKGEVLREVLGDFAAKNPGLSVRLVTGSGGEKLMTAIAAGSPPDVADMHGGEYSVLGMKGLLRPLDPLLKAHGGFQVKDLARGYERLGMYAGTRYTLPFWDIAPSYSLVYDAEAFDEAGVIRPARDRAPSWAEIGAFSKKLTLMDADGRLTRVGLHPKETWHTVSYTWESLFDVVLYQDGYRPNLGGNRTLASAITTMKELFVDPFPGILQFSPSVTSGRTTMIINGSHLIGGNLQRQLGKEVDATWAPHINGKLTQRWRAWSIGIPTGSKKPAEAIRLISYLLSDREAINTMWDKAGAFTANQEFLLAKSRQMPLLERWFIETLFHAERIVVEDMSPMKVTMQDAVRTAVDNVFTGKETPEAALDNAQAFAMGNWRTIYETQ